MNSSTKCNDEAEAYALDNFDLRADLFANLEQQHNIKIEDYARYFLRNHLLKVSWLLESNLDEPTERDSCKRILKHLSPLLAEANRQRELGNTAEAMGFQNLLCANEFLPLEITESERDELYFSDGPSPLESTLDGLEAVLKHIAASGKPGRPDKSAPRDILFGGLACIYEDCGGTVSAHYNPSTQRVDGGFVRFTEEIIDNCPDIMRHYFKSGNGEAVREWCRAKRNNAICSDEDKKMDIWFGRYQSGEKSRARDDFLMSEIIRVKNWR